MYGAISQTKTVTKLVLCAEIHSLIRKSSNIGSSNREKNKKSINKRIYTKRKKELHNKIALHFVVVCNFLNYWKTKKKTKKDCSACGVGV